MIPLRPALIALLLLSACTTPLYRQVALNLRDPQASPAVLCVCAHPDDEIGFAGTLYKISSFLGGRCDLVTITNGEGGFKYSTLAESIYGLELTEEEIGRKHLPRLRERELTEGLGYLGLRRLYLLDQQDHRYTQDPGEVLGAEAEVWDLGLIEAALDQLLDRGDYDYVFVMTPTATTHGHHQAASLLALRAVERLPREERPAVLAGRVREEGEVLEPWPPLDGYAHTNYQPGALYRFDRTQRFGHKNRLDYRIVANWAIAAHKSQGTMQLWMGRGAYEDYQLFELSGPDGHRSATELFEALAKPQFAPKTYGASAGTNAANN